MSNTHTPPDSTPQYIIVIDGIKYLACHECTEYIPVHQGYYNHTHPSELHVPYSPLYDANNQKLFGYYITQKSDISNNPENNPLSSNFSSDSQYDNNHLALNTNTQLVTPDPPPDIVINIQDDPTNSSYINNNSIKENAEKIIHSVRNILHYTISLPYNLIQRYSQNNVPGNTYNNKEDNGAMIV